MKKSLVLAMAMALGVTASAYAANPFSDVPAGHWAYDSVAKLADAGVVDGYGDGAFGGDKLLTRYEMAQITAKAMAKGCNVDKLAAEFADELDTLGVRVANLEKKADNFKVTGQLRASYKAVDADDDGDNDAFNLRTRLYVTGQVNEDWAYKGMLQSTQTVAGLDGDDEEGGNKAENDIKLNRAWVEGKLGGLNVVAGRYNEMPFTGNVLDIDADGVRVEYGKDVKVFGAAVKGWDSDESDDRINLVGVQGEVLGADAYAVYFKTNEDDAQEIWNVGFSTGVAEDLVLSAEYMRGDDEVAAPKAGKDGYWVDLAWKGASASEPGSFGFHVGYFDQSANAYIAPTTDAYHDNLTGGYEGWNVGASYTFAKNIVGNVNYFDLEDKVGDATAETIWSELYFFF